MKNLLMCVMICLGATAKAVPTRGGEVTNGGGVICFNGRCLTLQEAGLQLRPEYQGVWIPESAHFAVVKSTIQNFVHIPTIIRDALNYSIFGRVDHFRKVEVVDPIRLEEIKQRYLEIAEEAGTPIDPNTFEIVAISSDDTVTPALTYLLPKFFELTLPQQSSILIHEGLYRGRSTSDLKYVLQFESTIFDLQTNGLQTKTLVDQLVLSYRLGLIGKTEFIGTVFSVVYTSLDSIEWGKIPLENNIGRLNKDGKNMSLALDPSWLLRSAKSDPRIPYMFSRVDTIKLKETYRWRYSDGCTNLMSVNWEARGETQIINCSERQRDINEYKYRVYEVSNPEEIELVLPE